MVVMDRSTKLDRVVNDSPNVDKVVRINAGKLRRYRNQSLLQRLLDVRTIALNVRDIFMVLLGFLQSIKLLHTEKPDIIFIKGGFVAVPVGIAAGLMGRPFITHDSDTTPGLANRIISRWATLHAVGMPPELYSGYPSDKVVQVGIPIEASFTKVSKKHQQEFRQAINIAEEVKLILVIGGSLGSRNINKIVSESLTSLLEDEKVSIIHQTGSSEQAPVSDTKRYITHSFISDMYMYTGAADIVIARAGASSLAELAAQGKAVIVVPAPHLAGGHQLGNAAYLKERNAAVVMDESDLLASPDKLVYKIRELLGDEKQLRALGRNLQAVYPHGASQQVADLILELGGKS